MKNLEKDLNEAIRKKDIKLVKLLLKNGADIETKNEEGWTPLIFSCLIRDKKIIKFLLDNGADIEAEGKNGWTALIYSSMQGHKEVVKLLLDNGADIEAKSEKGLTALIYSSSEEDKEVVKLLLEYGADIEAKSEKGLTALIYSAGNGHKEVVKLLLENGADIEAKDKNGWTALIYSSGNGHKEVVKLLLEYGADIETKDESRWTALIASSWQGHKEVVKLLLEYGADIEAKSEKGLTALIYSAGNGHKEVVKLLLEYGADIETKDESRNTALIASSILGHKEVVKLLLENGADIEAKDKNGSTALINSSSEGHKEVVKLLLENGADIETKDESRWTALIYSSIQGHKEVVKLLLENGADIETKSESGWTALIYSSSEGHKEVVKLLLENGADIEAKDKNGWTALINSSSEGHKEVVKLLLENGADIEAEGKYGVTALTTSSTKILQLLLDNGANINPIQTSEETWSPLESILLRGSKLFHEMIKCKFKEYDISQMEKYLNNKEALSLFIAHGANLNSIMRGIPILALACIVSDIETIKFLIKNGADVNIEIPSNQEFNLLLLVLTMTEQTFKIILYNKGLDVGNAFINFHKNRFKLAQLLIDNGATITDNLYPFMIMNKKTYLTILNDKFDKKEYTIEEKEYHISLHASFNFGDIQIVKFLLKNNLDINYKIKDGETLLSVASWFNDYKMVQFLIENGADINAEEESFFDELFYQDKKELLKLVIHKIDEKIYAKNPKIMHNKEIFTVRKETKTSIPLKQKIKTNKSDFKTPMTDVLKSKDLGKLQDLLSTGYDISSISLINLIKGYYPLDFIELILKNGGNVNQIDKESWTPLIWAVTFNNLELVKLLVTYGANVEYKTKEDEEAYTFAYDLEITKILLNPFYYEVKSHTPQNLVNILTNFRQDTPIKYTTHDWDMNFTKEYKNFDGYIAKVTEQWYKIESELKALSPHIHKKIHTFLIEKTPNTKDDNWCSKEGDNIAMGWSSLDGLKEWCNEGQNPFDFILKEPLTIEGQTITTFGEVRNLFKQEIQVRNENNMLENIFLDIEEKYIDTLNIETIKLKGKSFYTDVEYFKNVLNRIFSEISKREAFEKIKVEVLEYADKEYIDLKIIHSGSEANRSIQEMLNISDGGDMASIKESLSNLCYWSVESSNEEENYRINYLKTPDEKESKILDYKPEGFTHILRFYK
ncbi:MAG: InterPro IPR002110 COGs COG0666 [uncultured Sulfurovum sp.]|uniref:InterPro IPR002110 COGs COG0666 n=1 Tax=uncultured Sulfurovum sp. TaxID=269237 RepID=A0A6S6T3J9_9BACT|nr:MAG: InterPro IPR002110 COGs COG0666 [uncultured Sulfurovum sp.]